jgi:predicted DNA binding CopG/RHH family protein
MKRTITVRIEDEELLKIKINLLKERKSFQQYVMELIRKDMKEKEDKHE